MFARPSAAGDIYGRPRSKILLSAIAFYKACEPPLNVIWCAIFDFDEVFMLLKVIDFKPQLYVEKYHLQVLWQSFNAF